MTKQRELEMLLLTMFAAVPLYFTQTIGAGPLIAFHIVMLGIVLRVASGRGPELIPTVVMRGLAIAYIAFYAFDAAVISRSAIAASTHLVLFIATFQPIESINRNNYAQRRLTAGRIFTASLATATHITIVLFVIAFSFLMFRQMMYVSHVETVRSLQRDYNAPPASRAAGFYLAGTTLIGMALFPMLPRLRNPVVQGYGFNATSTGMSESINFNEARTSSADPTVIARVTMRQAAMPFFTPLRLRATVYDAFRNNQWLQTRDTFREVRPRRGVFHIAKGIGFAQPATVQQRFSRSSRLFLPQGTYALGGLSQVWEGPTRDAYVTSTRAEMLTYQIWMARSVEPPGGERVHVVAYPVIPRVAALAKQIVGNETSPEKQAAAIEQYMSSRFQYVQRPEQIGTRPMTTDEFLLAVRRGHCEYFAAGMVALMSSLNVPARIVGGFYGGRLNPLTGYLVLRNEDAHAWVEVWTGNRWTTFDPTPASLRPGDSQAGLLGRFAGAISDSINYFWDRYILTFGLGDQIALFANVITQIRVTAMGLTQNARALGHAITAPSSLVPLSAIIGLIALVMMYMQRRRPLFDLIARYLKQLGVDVQASMTIEEALHLLRERDPDAARVFGRVASLYEAEQFSPRQDRTRIADIRKELATLRA